MKKAPTPRTTPMPLDFVMARVFDLYRELAAIERVADADARPRARREAREPSETVE